ncbi:hypothetical protein BCV70DRAFT_88726 [Testicularia cyperi]|uniref:Uncharacterized protein n=1 Tax=Testicularia cyperi TaxID=1882483 RepID=A0A317XT27_9BASI|nr:hypothetical protein BCV70DRAFT_88726 [Testicularia cyperi]
MLSSPSPLFLALSSLIWVRGYRRTFCTLVISAFCILLCLSFNILSLVAFVCNSPSALVILHPVLVWVCACVCVPLVRCYCTRLGLSSVPGSNPAWCEVIRRVW